MLIVGCDPGTSGAIALVDDKRGLLECENLPIQRNGAAAGSKIVNEIDARTLVGICNEWIKAHGYPALGVIERMSSFGGKTMTPAHQLLAMGHAAGLVQGVLLAGVVPTVERPLPQQWKAIYGLKGEKGASKRVALMLWPGAAKMLSRHDKAEAALIAHFGLRYLMGRKAA